MDPIVVIPLRAAKKGTPNKHTKILGNKPLFCWVLDTLLETRLTPHLWVATDCGEVKHIVGEYYPEVGVYERSARNSSDESLSDEVLLEFLEAHPQPDDRWVVAVQATAPFVSKDDFGTLFRTMRDRSECASLVACTRSKRFRWSDDERPLDYALGCKPHHGDYAGHWVETGAFYAVRAGDLRRNRLLICEPVGLVEVGNEAYLNVDGEWDFRMAEGCARYRI